MNTTRLSALALLFAALAAGQRIGPAPASGGALSGGCTQLPSPTINGPCSVTITAAQLATLSSTVSVAVLPAVSGKTYVFMGSPSVYYHFNSTAYTLTGTDWGWVLAQPGLDLNGIDTWLISLAGFTSASSSDQFAVGSGLANIGPGQNSPPYVGQAINLYLGTDGGMTGGSTGYNVGDTGTISGCGDGTAIYTVATLLNGAGGAVSTVTVAGGTGYTVVANCATTISTGTGAGTMVLNIGSAPGGAPAGVVIPPNGDGTLTITFPAYLVR